MAPCIGSSRVAFVHCTCIVPLVICSNKLSTLLAVYGWLSIAGSSWSWSGLTLAVVTGLCECLAVGQHGDLWNSHTHHGPLLRGLVLKEGWWESQRYIRLERKSESRLTMQGECSLTCCEYLPVKHLRRRWMSAESPVRSIAFIQPCYNLKGLHSITLLQNITHEGTLTSM